MNSSGYKVLGFVAVIQVLLSTSALAQRANQAEADEPKNDPFYVYRDAESEENHGEWTNYTPEKASEMLELTLSHETDPHTGATCIRINTNSFVKPNWAGIAVSCDADYWGEEMSDTAFDLRKKKKLVFWAKGERGGGLLPET